MLKRNMLNYLIIILICGNTWTNSIQASEGRNVLKSSARQNLVTLTPRVFNVKPPNAVNVTPPSVESVPDITVPECLEVLKSCDSALKAREAHAQAQQVVISKQDMLLDKQVERIQSLENSKDAWYNSKTLWMIIGGALGGTLVYKLKR